MISKVMAEAIFGRKSKEFRRLINKIGETYGSTFKENAGHCFKIMHTSDQLVEGEHILSVGGNTRLSVHFTDQSIYSSFPTQNGKSFVKPSFRLDIPTRFLSETRKPNYWLYNIRFAIECEKADILEPSMLPLRAGYYGITKRHIFDRFKEHERDTINGKGHLLHKAWRGLGNTGAWFCPVMQISGYADTLSEIYDMEEEAVDKMSLAPKGLNVIPGGKAGIRMLHKLSIINREIITPEIRDDALCELEVSSASGKKCTHYRSGHFRKLFTGKTTWVSPCWVNLDRGVL